MNLPFMPKHNFTESGMVKLDDFMSALSVEQSLPKCDGR